MSLNYKKDGSNTAITSYSSVSEFAGEYGVDASTYFRTLENGVEKYIPVTTNALHPYATSMKIMKNGVTYYVLSKASECIYWSQAESLANLTNANIGIASVVNHPLFYPGHWGLSTYYHATWIPNNTTYTTTIQPSGVNPYYGTASFWVHLNNASNILLNGGSAFFGGTRTEGIVPNYYNFVNNPGSCSGWGVGIAHSSPSLYYRDTRHWLYLLFGSTVIGYAPAVYNTWVNITVMWDQYKQIYGGNSIYVFVNGLGTLATTLDLPIANDLKFSLTANNSFTNFSTYYNDVNLDNPKVWSSPRLLAPANFNNETWY